MVWSHLFSLTHNLKKKSCLKQIESRAACSKKLKSEKSRFQEGLLKDIIPNGLSEEIWCVTNNELTEKNCLTDSGSPVILSKDGTARGQYFEQQFVLGPLL